VFRVFDGKGRPQLPVALGTGLQATEQRVPLFSLMTGNADIDFAPHAFLEKIGQAGEQIIEASKALFQLAAHFADLLWYHPARETVTGALAAFVIFAGAKIRHLL